MSVWLQLSSGQGPVECAWVVARLAEAIGREAADRGLTVQVLEAEPGDAPGTSQSVLFEVEGPDAAAWAAGWAGTVQWIGASPFRPHHKRRNWFVGVSVFAPPAAIAWSDREVRVETARASGPGGQHVNKTESAVRVTHVPTGLTAIAQEGRSQHQNRKLAVARLARLLADRQANGEAEARSERWAQHQALERGNPRRVFEGTGFRSKIP